MFARLRARRPSPAMVIALIALFVAMGGTATALQGSNTVFSDDITNGQVKSADVANDSGPAALRGTDVAANSLTGSDITDGQVTSADVANDSGPGALAGGDVATDSLNGSDIDESSLGAVPDANSLGGTPASDYGKGFSARGAAFSSTLPLAVPGVGTVTLACENGGTPGNDSDDQVGINFVNTSGSSAVVGWGTQGISGSSNPTVTHTTELAASGNASLGIPTGATKLYSDLVVTLPSGAATTFHASVAQLPSSDDCVGQVHAVRSG